MTEITVADLLYGPPRKPGRHIFRGEREYYSHRVPAVYRSIIGIEDYDDVIERAFIGMHQIGETLYHDLVAPKLRYHYGFSLHKGNVVGDSLLAGYIAPGPTRFRLQIMALLQHYGMPTHFLDVTFDPFVALYFACWSSDTGTFHEDGYGYIYHWNAFELNETERDDFSCFDLKEAARFFVDEGIASTIRPHVQRAAALCVGSWLHPLWADRVGRYLDLLNARATCFVVDRSKIDYSIFNGFNPYPEEPLVALLRPYIDKR